MHTRTYTRVYTHVRTRTYGRLHAVNELAKFICQQAITCS